MNKRELILTLQGRNCYNCRWHKELIPWIAANGQHGIELDEWHPKTYNQAVDEAIEAKKKLVVYKCCLDYGQRTNFPEERICINHKRMNE
jgi:hypothetical protein